MTRGDIRTRIRTHIDEPQEERWKDTELNGLINSAADEVAALILSLDDSHYIEDDEFSLTTDELYDLPADFHMLKEIVDENGDPLSEIDPSKRADYIGIGITRVYYFQKNQIGFLDISTGAKTFPYKYIRQPSAQLSLDNTDDAETPDCPAFLCHSFIAVLASIEALDMDEETDAVLARKARRIRNLIYDNYHKRSVDGPRVVGGDPDLDGLDE